MDFDIRKINYKHLLLLIVITYFFVNFLTLMSYPFVHSDETWLMGLTKHALSERSFKVTEPFFDIYPRAIHGLRVIFMIFQALAMKIFGGGIFSVRMLSLLASSISLFVLGTYFKKLGTLAGLMATLTLAINIQYVLHSHSGRQEALILMLMVICFFLLDQVRPFWIGSLIGLAIGIHPNSFLIACGIGCYYLITSLQRKKIIQLMEFLVTLILWASLFILLSLYLNPNFFGDYLAYGETQGITNFEIGRLEGFYYFYYKLYHQIGGTYLLENIKGILILQVLSLLFGIGILFTQNAKKTIKPLAMLIGINLGIMIIGRYNQTSIIFPIVFTWLLFFTLLSHLKKPILYGILSLLLVYQFQVTFTAMTHYENDDYYGLEKELKVIPENSVVLGNINLLEHVTTDKFYDYRNLWNFDGDDLMTYLNTHDIDYVIWPEEMDYIHDLPTWHILYGPMAYYDDFKAFLSHQEVVHTFTSSTYGMRIAKYVNTYPWEVKIYKIQK